VQSANGNLNLHKSWIATLEKLSQKAKEISKQTADPDANKEFYYLWAKMYEKAFDNLFENIPIARSFEKFLEPVKNTARLYADTFTIISKMWLKSYPCSTSAVFKYEQIKKIEILQVEASQKKKPKIDNEENERLRKFNEELRSCKAPQPKA